MPDLQGDVREGALQKRSVSTCHDSLWTTSLLQRTYQDSICSFEITILVMRGAWLASAARRWT